jgi:hypothetical protein
MLDQQNLREKYYGEAMRYMNNARKYLSEAKKEGDFYHDKKYVKTACGTAYNGLLVALDGYLQLKDIKPKGKERKSIEYYQSNITKIDKKMINYLNSAYVGVVKRGFDLANTIIEKIKPQ